MCNFYDIMQYKSANKLSQYYSKDPQYENSEDTLKIDYTNQASHKEHNSDEQIIKLNTEIKLVIYGKSNSKTIIVKEETQNEIILEIIKELEENDIEVKEAIDFYIQQSFQNPNRLMNGYIAATFNSICNP